MSSEKKSRAVEKGLRTRFRRAKAISRRSNVAVERERVEKGEPLLKTSFQEVPSVHSFLPIADLFEKKGKKITAAFIFCEVGPPDTRGTIRLFWYVAGKANASERARDTFEVSSKKGHRFRITPTTALAPSTAKVRGKTYTRSCTGVDTFDVERVRDRE